MEDKEIDLLNFDLNAITEKYLDMNLSISIDLKDSIENVGNSFFTTFYSTAAYYFNYALEVMTPLAGNICSYFRENTDGYEL